MKNIEIIGEAANMLTRNFRMNHSELPWRMIVGMRNVLTHGYANVSELMGKLTNGQIAEATGLTIKEVDGIKDDTT